MEIREIVSYYINHSNDVMEVSFRTTDDEDNELRSTEISTAEIIAFGYDFVKGDLNILESFDDEDEDFLDELDIIEDETWDENDISQFLNEYYALYPNLLPKKELF
jgi:hypothetical protein